MSTTARYCSHCEADLDGGSTDGATGGPVDRTSAGAVPDASTVSDDDEGRAVETAVIDFGAGPGTASETSAETGVDTGQRPAGEAGAGRPAERRSTVSRTADGPETLRDGAGGEDRDWFHPESLLDDVSTGVVGIVAGLVVGSLATVLALFATGSALAFLVGPVGGVGVGLYVGRTRSVFRAVRKACYLIAPTLVAVPLFWFGDAPEGGNFAGRIVAFVVTELAVLPVALLLVGLGYWIGGKAPDA